MIEPRIPENEAARVAALHALNVLYTPSEDRFDRITRLARRLLDVPIALVSLVDSDCQWFKAVEGLDASETPRAISFCGHAILGDDTLIVPDAREDPRFAHNPLVVGEPFIRFYAGHPLQASDGSRVGTLCIIDRRPRNPSATDLETLRDLAGWVANELQVNALSRAQAELIAERDQLRRKSMIDSLTRLWNREAILDVLEREMDRAERDAGQLCVVLADIDHFKRINDTHGHVAGDAVLRCVAQRMRAALRPYDAVGRYGGEEFLLALVNCGVEQGMQIAERVRERVASSACQAPDEPIPVTLSLGLVTWNAAAATGATELIDAADGALYRAKESGRNRLELASLA